MKSVARLLHLLIFGHPFKSLAGYSHIIQPFFWRVVPYLHLAHLKKNYLKIKTVIGGSKGGVGRYKNDKKRICRQVACGACSWLLYFVFALLRLTHFHMFIDSMKSHLLERVSKLFVFDFFRWRGKETRWRVSDETSTIDTPNSCHLVLGEKSRGSVWADNLPIECSFLSQEGEKKVIWRFRFTLPGNIVVYNCK